MLKGYKICLAIFFFEHQPQLNEPKYMNGISHYNVPTELHKSKRSFGVSKR